MIRAEYENACDRAHPAECVLVRHRTTPNIPPKKPNVASLDPQDWYIFYSDDMPFHPSADSTVD